MTMGIFIRRAGRVLAIIVGLLFLAFAANELATSQWWYAGIDGTVAVVAFWLAHRLRRRVERMRLERVSDPRHPVTPLPPH